MMQFFVQKITMAGVELKVPVTNVTIAIQWYHRLLHMDGKTSLAPYHRKHVSLWYKTSTAWTHHLKGLRELKYCSGLEWGIYTGLGRRF